MIWQIASIILCVSVVTNVNGERHGRFKQSFCAEINGINCLPFPQNTVEKPSQWPAGPFVLPMSIYGCPESHAHGWREGYISLTFHETIQVYTSRGNTSLYDYNLLMVDINWPFSTSYVMGPLSGKTIKLNFCYKQRKSKTLDVDDWFQGNYSIYSADGTCQKAILQLHLCSHLQEGDIDVKSTYKAHPFILLKNSDNECPQFFEEETLGLGTNLSLETSVLQTYCNFYPDSWLTVDEDKLFEALIAGGM
ncbi:uncharacterized protein LOC132742657 [Ruditapes philippinarum]|uniref:uncharacterized protein LOC132742657 n=1 Tax=Ruditapes philippinarum TaxID=129788 RepID=UPI00295A7F9A|nr:uncharacterized protein LOC132742657 [Ruditapes philippinarum]